MTSGVYKRTPEMKTGIYERTPEMKTGKHKRTPEMNTAISKGQKNSEAVKAYADSRRGVPKTPEQIAAIIEGQEESGMYEAMRGGNDIVNHHVAYDFGGPDALRVRITRKFHGAIHHPPGIGIHQRGYSLID